MLGLRMLGLRNLGSVIFLRFCRFRVFGFFPGFSGRFGKNPDYPEFLNSQIDKNPDPEKFRVFNFSFHEGNICSLQHYL